MNYRPYSESLVLAIFKQVVKEDYKIDHREENPALIMRLLPYCTPYQLYIVEENPENMQYYSSTNPLCSSVLSLLGEFLVPTSQGLRLTRHYVTVLSLVHLADSSEFEVKLYELLFT